MTKNLILVTNTVKSDKTSKEGLQNNVKGLQTSNDSIKNNVKGLQNSIKQLIGMLCLRGPVTVPHPANQVTQHTQSEGNGMEVDDTLTPLPAWEQGSSNSQKRHPARGNHSSPTPALWQGETNQNTKEENTTEHSQRTTADTNDISNFFRPDTSWTQGLDTTSAKTSTTKKSDYIYRIQMECWTMKEKYMIVVRT